MRLSIQHPPTSNRTALRLAAALLLVMASLALGACHRAEQQAQQAAALAATREAAAEQSAKAFDDAVAVQSWPAAKAQGDVLLMQYPGTRAAQRIAAQMDAVRAKANATRDAARLSALWNYTQLTVKGGTQRGAAIDSKEPVDVDGGGAKRVQLIFRDHPAWGRSAYLVLQSGDFACRGGCKVNVSVDNAAAKPMAASRPNTDEAIAMFIEDERALWRMATHAKTLSVTFPVKAGGTRTAVFETGGLDPSQMPGWR